MTSRLYRSRTDVMVGGGCGGLARYLNVDPTLVRLVAVLLALSNGIGVMLYILLWIILPLEEPGQTSADDAARLSADEVAGRVQALGGELGNAIGGAHPRAGALIGGSLVLIGTLFLIDRMNVVWLRWFEFDMLWPLLLMIGGAALLWRTVRPQTRP